MQHEPIEECKAASESPASRMMSAINEAESVTMMLRSVCAGIKGQDVPEQDALCGAGAPLSEVLRDGPELLRDHYEQQRALIDQIRVETLG